MVGGEGGLKSGLPRSQKKMRFGHKMERSADTCYTRTNLEHTLCHAKEAGRQTPRAGFLCHAMSRSGVPTESESRLHAA